MRHFGFPLALLACLLFASAASAAEPVFPPGSRIGLVPPPGMSVSRLFQGFEDRTHGAMLVVTELSAQSYAKVEKDFSPEQMAASGMEVILREYVGLPGGEGLLVVARQQENGVLTRKWALLMPGADMMAIVIASMPDSAKDAYPDAALRDAFASVTIRAKLKSAEMLAVLPYALNDLGGFRLLRTTPDGTAVMTLGPGDTTLPAEQPYFMVAPRAAEPPQPAERERFAQQMMAGFLSRPNVRVINSEQMRISGVPGHQIVALGKDERTGDELVMVQWLRFGPGVVQMFGMARRDQWADVLPRMRMVRDGFGPK